jgi:hypothetical protein
MRRAVITFIDGTNDWVDPVVDVKETDRDITIYNGHYEYTYEKEGVKNVEYVEVEEGTK